VTVLAAFTVIVVEAAPELTNVIEFAGAVLHEENVYPEATLADIDWADAPALYHVAVEGVVDPPALGLAAKVTWYCVW
jgi:hypothetical protein